MLYIHIYYIFSLYTTCILFVLDFSSEELDIYYRHERVGVGGYEEGIVGV